jgi:hypothetical protein
MAKHLPTLCQARPSICQRFAKRGQAFVAAKHLPRFCLWRPSICQFATCLFAHDGQGFANGLPVTAKHLLTPCL